MKQTEQNTISPETNLLNETENNLNKSLLDRLERISKTQIRTYNQLESLKKKIKRDLMK
jgi:archaellum component FlaC